MVSELYLIKTIRKQVESLSYKDAINLQLQGSSLTASVDGNGFLTIVSDFAGSGYDIQ